MIPILVAKHLRKTIIHKKNGYSNSQAILTDVNLEVNPSDSVGIIGASGSGKSTLLSILGTLSPFDDGELTICSEDISKTTDFRRTLLRRDRIGFVFQNHSLLPNLNASENISLPKNQDMRQSRKNSAAKNNSSAMQLLEKVGLNERAYDYPIQLSVGERQRVAIARALINSPKLLLADEPTSALDEKTALKTIELLLALAKNNGIAVILVTHDLKIAQMMDKILVLQDGRLANIDDTRGTDDSNW
ncbi:MAG: ABC transporter ATP-binding protein [Candidatus Ancillula sp.]|jgi:putative ABC transport system ATP-binding protein|nr:ABC transporter ATP-binding protein [Candidatus Ancillula sp.]